MENTDQRGKRIWDYVILTMLFFASYGIIILNEGIFWDDWVVVTLNHAPKDIIALFKELGFFLYWPAYLHNSIFSLSDNISVGIFLERIIILCSYLASAFFTYEILRKLKQFEKNTILIITMLFMLFPVNAARIAMCNIHYAICYFLFFLGSLLSISHFSTKRVILRVFSLLLLFISYSTNSFLVFSYLIPVVVIFSKKSNIKSIKTFFIELIKVADYLLIPILFWVIKSKFFISSGIYQDYNSISLKNMLISPAYILYGIKTSFFDVLNDSFLTFLSQISSPIIVAIVLFLILRRRLSINDENGNLFYTIAGLIVLVAGIFPYAVLKAQLWQYDWLGRHQLLVPLGSALLLFFGIRLLMEKLRVKKTINTAIFAVIIGIFTVTNFNIYLEYQRDWFKQLSIIENFKESKIIAENHTFVFTDNTLDLNARKRIYRFYDYTGLMKIALNEETRLGMGEESNNAQMWSDVEKEIKTGLYNINDYVPGTVDYRVIINYGTQKLESRMTLYKLIIQKWTDEQAFRRKILECLSFEYVKL